MNRQYIGARYVPIFADPIEWDSRKSYEALTIVEYLGGSYTSKKNVPSGIEPTNKDYWVQTGNYNAQIEEYRQEAEEAKNIANNANDKVNALNPVIESCTFNTGIGATNYFSRLVKIGRIVFVMAQFNLGNQVTKGTVIYTLPNGFAPKSHDQIVCNSKDNTSQMNVTTDGYLTLGATQDRNEYTCIGFYHLY